MKQRGLANSPARTTLFLRDSDLNGVDCQERSAKRPIGLDYFLLEAVSRRGMGGNGGCSSAGRALDLHSRGRRFDPDQLHQNIIRGQCRF